MFSKKQKGFTLIELLVVIAIIGLLAGIVLVSLGGARDSAKNARIQGSLQQTKSLAELVYSANIPASYSGTQSLCRGTQLNSNPGGNTSYGTQLASLGSDVSTQNGGTEAVCYASGDNYCVSAALAGGAGTFVCISSTGQTGNDPCGSATATCTP